jgi:hypothetical protein
VEELCVLVARLALLEGVVLLPIDEELFFSGGGLRLDRMPKVKLNNDVLPGDPGGREPCGSWR